MTSSQPIPSERDHGMAEMVTMYERLAAMDPAALRSLAVKLQYPPRHGLRLQPSSRNADRSK
jgi:predicted NUDIX family NTP pyrophosphohydrolase